MGVSKVSELYPSKWLSPADLQKPVFVTIASVDIEDMRQADGSRANKLVLTFRNAHKRMVLNATQAKRLAELLGDEFTHWPGARVKLAPSKASNGKDTIAVLEALRLPEQPPAGPPSEPAATSTSTGQAATGMSDKEAAELWHK